MKRKTTFIKPPPELHHPTLRRIREIYADEEMVASREGMRRVTWSSNFTEADDSAWRVQYLRPLGNSVVEGFLSGLADNGVVGGITGLTMQSYYSDNAGKYVYCLSENIE